MTTKSKNKSFNFKTGVQNAKDILTGHHVQGFVSQLVIYVILFTISYVFLYPLLRMVSMSFMTTNDIINPEVDWVPTTFTFKNFISSAFVMGMPKTLFNSIWFSGTLAIFQTTVSALTGFAFARYNFRFKQFWFGMILVSFILPLPVVLIPRVMLFTSVQGMLHFQLIGTIIPQLLMALLGQGINSAILILIFFNFFKMIPVALDEAAKMDGATALQIFWHVIVKLSLPTIITVFLFSFVWNWNETYVTSTFVRGSIKLLPQQLSMFESQFSSVATRIPGQQGEALINEAYKMAGTLISILPLLIMYAFAQKQFIEGIENTGIK